MTRLMHYAAVLRADGDVSVVPKAEKQNALN
jgi:hypothetical protein